MRFLQKAPVFNHLKLGNIDFDFIDTSDTMVVSRGSSKIEKIYLYYLFKLFSMIRRKSPEKPIYCS